MKRQAELNESLQSKKVKVSDKKAAVDAASDKNSKKRPRESGEKVFFNFVSYYYFYSFLIICFTIIAACHLLRNEFSLGPFFFFFFFLMPVLGGRVLEKTRD